ncbi:glycosyltransferase family 2 protein [Tellurirhabdus rosea]|uniref:glycosyltransferase family 2 protein n=1 Tax=Tellurirhabdus rosea TaxID=2674997 RepID=UPI00225769CC|nr:glycosyltransferase family 2 protein [Tellurirhabdus rosea]
MKTALSLLFWVCVFLTGYTYLGYGLLIWVLNRVRKMLKLNRSRPDASAYWPEVTVVIPAYNERAFLPAKLKNSLSLAYPADRIRLLFVTEGSIDGSMEWLLEARQRYDRRIDVLGGSVRRGKVAAMNRAMKYVKSPIVIFTDANTNLNAGAIRNIVAHFADPDVGAVAGEKRIELNAAEAAAGAGEGLYWKYESFLKKQDAELHTIVGAAGELFALRTELFEEVEADTLLDDFIISLRIAGRGYRVQYAPDAFALERPSFSIEEEKKRKIRIATGGFQSIVRLAYLLNPFRYGWLTFQYLSHRVLRWAVAPFCLPLMLLASVLLTLVTALESSQLFFFWAMTVAAQIGFYLAALLGYVAEHRQLRVKLLFIPYYFTFMNVCAIAGLMRYLKGTPATGIWEKARRAEDAEVNPAAETV